MGWTAWGVSAAILLVGAAGGAAACGSGELALPGTAGCLRLGGVARAEAAAGGGSRAIAPASPTVGRAAAALRAGARIDLDARVPTAAGPLRAYLSAGTGAIGQR